MKAARLTASRILSRGFLSGLLTLGLLTTAASAGDEPDNDFMLGGGSSGGIGTVPDEGGSTGGVPVPNASGFLPGMLVPQKPALRLVGTLAELDLVIASTYSPDGTGWFRLTPLQGQLSLEFYGDTVVELNRTAFAHSGVSVQLSVAPNFAGGVAVLAAPGGRHATQGLAAGNMNLRLHRLVQSGLADSGLQLTTRSAQGARSSLQFSSQAGRILLAQNH